MMAPTDTTPAIAQRFVDREPRIFKLISKENGGHGSTINTGLAVATGRYFRVVDGDDWVDTEGLVRLTEQLRALDADLVVDEKREVDMKTGASKLFPLVEGTVTGQVLPFSTVCRDPAISSQIMIHTLTVRTQLMRDAGVRLPRAHVLRGLRVRGQGVRSGGEHRVLRPRGLSVPRGQREPEREPCELREALG